MGRGGCFLRRGGRCPCCADRRRGCPVLGQGGDMPVIVHVVFFVLKTVEVPQLQYLDKVVANFFVQFIKVADVPVIIQRQAPAVLVRVRDGSRFSSSTEWWTFPVCSSDVHPQCKLYRRPARSHRCCSWTRLMPVVHNNRCLTVQKTVDSDQVVDISVVVQRQIPMVVQETIEILQLQYTDKVIVVPVVPVQVPSAVVEKTAELLRSSWTRWLTCLCVQRQCS